VNGLWLSPAEVESVLVSHDAVHEAAIVGRQDDDGLVKPAAYVVLTSEAAAREQASLEMLAQELRDLVGQRIGGYKRPRWIEFVREIPKTATGKLQRFKLREGQVGQANGGTANRLTAETS
jgi:4-hydroxybenzoate-CoA ligase